MNELIEDLRRRLHAAMPVARSMGVRVCSYDGSCLTLAAPLAPNTNDAGTAFAGSLNALATLAGWSLMWLVAREADLSAGVMIQNSSINFIKPVTSDFSVTCRKPEPAMLADFLAALSRKGRARIELAAEIMQAGEPCVTFVGRYVAAAKKLNDER